MKVFGPFKCFCLIGGVLTSVLVFAKPPVLDLSEIPTLVLKKGLASKDLEILSQKPLINLLSTEGTFDTLMTLKGQNEDSHSEVLNAITNRRDQTQSYSLGFSRHFSSGSTVAWDYSFFRRESDLSTTAQTIGLGRPLQYYHLNTFSFKQDLLFNAFGFRDRRLLDATRWQFQRAQLDHAEGLEDVILQGIKVYLEAYTAQESLKQSLAARDKYQVLLKAVQQKNKMGFDDRSELLKTRAELQNQERNVKSATLAVTNLTGKLYNILNLPPPEHVEFQIQDPLPAPERFAERADRPETSSAETLRGADGLRKLRSSELLVQAAQSEKDAAANGQRPSLNFYTTAAFTGLDPNNDNALYEINHHEHPKYTLGLELTYRWGGNTQKAEGLSKALAFEEALNTKAKIQNDLKEALERTARNLQSHYLIAKNAQETVQIWEGALKSQEANHRYGRITTAELINDFGSYFRAKSLYSSALADYHWSIYEFQAARDGLLPSHPSSKPSSEPNTEPRFPQRLPQDVLKKLPGEAQ